MVKINYKKGFFVLFVFFFNTGSFVYLNLASNPWNTVSEMQVPQLISGPSYSNQVSWRVWGLLVALAQNSRNLILNSVFANLSTIEITIKITCLTLLSEATFKNSSHIQYQMHPISSWVFLGSADDFWRRWYSGFVFPTTIMHAVTVLFTWDLD